MAPKVHAAIRSVSVRRAGKKIDFVVVLDLGEAVSGTETLAKGSRTVIRRAISLSRTGRISLVTRVEHALAAGRYTMRLTLVDAQGAKLSLSRTVQVRVR